MKSLAPLTALRIPSSVVARQSFVAAAHQREKGGGSSNGTLLPRPTLAPPGGPTKMISDLFRDAECEQFWDSQFPILSS